MSWRRIIVVSSTCNNYSLIMFEEGQEILDKRYRVIKKLGGGAFGEIYKGKSTLASHSACQVCLGWDFGLWFDGGWILRAEFKA